MLAPGADIGVGVGVRMGVGVAPPTGVWVLVGVNGGVAVPSGCVPDDAAAVGTVVGALVTTLVTAVDAAPGVDALTVVEVSARVGVGVPA